MKHGLPRACVLLLAVSFGLRAVLSLRGGQAFFPDEARYDWASQLLQSLARGEVREGLRTALDDIPHLGFTFLSLIPALAQHLLTLLAGIPAARTLWLAALFFSLISVACILAVYALARRAGAGEREALLAAGLLACSTTLIYWSRHLAPYEACLLLNLAALWIGLGGRPALQRGALIGLLGSLAFTVYNGGWAGTAAVLLFALYRLRTPRELAAGGAGVLLGFLSVPLALQAASLQLGVLPYLRSLRQFSRTATQGVMSEGWSLPWAFLWSAEHGILLLWLAGALLAVLLRNDSDPSFRARTLAWGLLLVAVYGALVIGSTLLGRAVVYGRNTHSMLPFLCLLAAAGVHALLEAWRPRRALLAAAGVLIALQVAWNLRTPLGQRFPSDFLEHAIARYPNARVVSNIRGVKLPRQPPAASDSEYSVVNALYLHPIQGVVSLPEAAPLWKTAHPTEYRPYQYEGFTPRERELLRATDISMRVLRASKD